mmetsp:Transcript_176734/g.561251  ORF Transcript_176734/g.561251 Transcript_176734/m.561251 type:complete len:281 (+) Transcript_176734:273-1115(+)
MCRWRPAPRSWRRHRTSVDTTCNSNAANRQEKLPPRRCKPRKRNHLWPRQCAQQATRLRARAGPTTKRRPSRGANPDTWPSICVQLPQVHCHPPRTREPPMPFHAEVPRAGVWRVWRGNRSNSSGQRAPTGSTRRCAPARPPRRGPTPPAPLAPPVWPPPLPRTVRHRRCQPRRRPRRRRERRWRRHCNGTSGSPGNGTEQPPDHHLRSPSLAPGMSSAHNGNEHAAGSPPNTAQHRRQSPNAGRRRRADTAQPRPAGAKSFPQPPWVHLDADGATPRSK